MHTAHSYSAFNKAKRFSRENLYPLKTKMEKHNSSHCEYISLSVFKIYLIVKDRLDLFKVDFNLWDCILSRASNLQIQSVNIKSDLINADIQAKSKKGEIL